MSMIYFIRVSMAVLLLMLSNSFAAPISTNNVCFYINWEDETPVLCPNSNSNNCFEPSSPQTCYVPFNQISDLCVINQLSSCVALSSLCPSGYPQANGTYQLYGYGFVQCSLIQGSCENVTTPCF